MCVCMHVYTLRVEYYRLCVQDDKQYGMILEVIKNDSLRQIEKERSVTLSLSVCLSVCVSVCQ